MGFDNQVDVEYDNEKYLWVPRVLAFRFPPSSGEHLIHFSTSKNLYHAQIRSLVPTSHWRWTSPKRAPSDSYLRTWHECGFQDSPKQGWVLAEKCRKHLLNRAMCSVSMNVQTLGWIQAVPPHEISQCSSRSHELLYSGNQNRPSFIELHAIGRDICRWAHTTLHIQIHVLTDILCYTESSSLLLRNKYSASFLYSNLPRITEYWATHCRHHGWMDRWISTTHTCVCVMYNYVNI